MIGDARHSPRRLGCSEDLQHALSDRFKLDDVATPVHPFVVASVLDPATKVLDNFSGTFKQAVIYVHQCLQLLGTDAHNA